MRPLCTLNTFDFKRTLKFPITCTHFEVPAYKKKKLPNIQNTSVCVTSLGVPTYLRAIFFERISNR